MALPMVVMCYVLCLFGVIGLISAELNGDGAYR